MKALITGGGGQLASDLQSRLGADAVSLSKSELDVGDGGAVDRVVSAARPDVIFNCAAFHNLDECEARPDRSFAVNVDGVRNLSRHGIKVVHISTNYVFDGRRVEPYVEDDLPAPRSIYAISKLAGEHAALAYCDRALVIRTAGLYGLYGSASKGGNFVQRMLRRARDTGELKVVADQFLSPTYTGDLADALLEAVRLDATGLVHLTAGGACSWHEFTEAIMELAGVGVEVQRAETVIAPDGVDRPLNGVLASTHAETLGLSPLPGWSDGLRRYIAQAGLSAASA